MPAKVDQRYLFTRDELTAICFVRAGTHFNFYDRKGHVPGVIGADLQRCGVLGDVVRLCLKTINDPSIFLWHVMDRRCDVGDLSARPEKTKFWLEEAPAPRMASIVAQCRIEGLHLDDFKVEFHKICRCD